MIGLEELDKTPAVLVAEDNTISARLMMCLIQKFTGTAPCFAANGQEAYEKVVNGNYDLVFMDHQMPICSGDEAVQLIRSDESIENQPFIVGLSASAEGEMENFENCGLDMFITKPIPPAKLEHIMDLVTERSLAA